MKYFIATPTSSDKAYAHTAWTNSIKSQNTTPKISYQVAISDSSATSAYSNTLKTLITADIKNIPDISTLELDPKLVLAHEDLRQRFLASTADVFLSWESDVIAEAGALVKLDPYLQGADIVMCSYPEREDPKQNVVAMGFTAFKRSIIEKYPFDTAGGYGQCVPDIETYFGSDGWILYRARLGGAKIIQLTNIVALNHI